jgi:hypothetical protein
MSLFFNELRLIANFLQLFLRYRFIEKPYVSLSIPATINQLNPPPRVKRRERMKPEKSTGSGGCWKRLKRYESVLGIT